MQTPRYLVETNRTCDYEDGLHGRWGPFTKREDAERLVESLLNRPGIHSAEIVIV